MCFSKFFCVMFILPLGFYGLPCPLNVLLSSRSLMVMKLTSTKYLILLKRKQFKVQWVVAVITWITNENIILLRNMKLKYLYFVFLDNLKRMKFIWEDSNISKGIYDILRCIAYVPTLRPSHKWYLANCMENNFFYHEENKKNNKTSHDHWYFNQVTESKLLLLKIYKM